MTSSDAGLRVTVCRKGHLADGPRDPEESVGLPAGAVTTDLLAACGVDPRACVVVVNGAAVPGGTALSDGDRVQLYPAQAGG